MADMNFGVNLLPKTNKGYSLGNANYQWNFYGNLTGTADKAVKDANGNVIDTSYLPLTGGTMSGNILMGDNHIYFNGTSIDPQHIILYDNEDGLGTVFMPGQVFATGGVDSYTTDDMMNSSVIFNGLTDGTYNTFYGSGLMMLDKDTSVFTAASTSDDNVVTPIVITTFNNDKKIKDINISSSRYNYKDSTLQDKAYVFYNESQHCLEFIVT